MHSSHAAFIFREEHRQELLSFAEQQRLVKLACAGAPSVKPHAAMAMAIRAFVHGLTAFMPLALREQRSTGPVSTAVDSPKSFIAPRS
jgi:hypothetical protein